MCLSHHLLQTPGPLLLPNPPSASPLCLTCGCSQTVFQKLSETKQNFPLSEVAKKRRKRKRRGHKGITCEATHKSILNIKGMHRIATIYKSQKGIKNKYNARAFVIPVLVTEIVIKLQREMDVKIGLDTNYQKERHLCKCFRSLNFSHSEPSPHLVCLGARGQKKKRLEKLPSLIPTDETLILVWLESSAKTQNE